MEIKGIEESNCLKVFEAIELALSELSGKVSMAEVVVGVCAFLTANKLNEESRELLEMEE